MTIAVIAATSPTWNGMITGDITNGGRPEEAERASSLLNALQCPFFVTPGNHDDRTILWATFGGRACLSHFGEFFNYVIEGHDVRLIALDSTRPGAPGGEICHRNTS